MCRVIALESVTCFLLWTLRADTWHSRRGTPGQEWGQGRGDPGVRTLAILMPRMSWLSCPFLYIDITHRPSKPINSSHRLRSQSHRSSVFFKHIKHNWLLLTSEDVMVNLRPVSTAMHCHWRKKILVIFIKSNTCQTRSSNFWQMSTYKFQNTIKIEYIRNVVKYVFKGWKEKNTDDNSLQFP